MANVYSDINNIFAKNSLGDIDLVVDEESIKQSLKNVILTKQGAKTKYQKPIYGTNTHDLLFEKINPVIENILRKDIEIGIKNYEPRVELLDVDIKTDDSANRISIILHYRILALQKTDTVTFDIDIIK